MQARTIAFFLCAMLTASFAFAQDYQSVLIVAPKPDMTIHSNQGNLRVKVKISPPLHKANGDRVTLLVDGQTVANVTKTQYVLTGIDRGAHTLEVQVTNANGDVLAKSEQVTFYMWHASRLFQHRR